MNRESLRTQTLEQEWEHFASCVLTGIPRTSVQWTEMRKAFIAGAQVSMWKIESISDLPEEMAIRQMSVYQAQLKLACRTCGLNLS